MYVIILTVHSYYYVNHDIVLILLILIVYTPMLTVIPVHLIEYPLVVSYVHVNILLFNCITIDLDGCDSHGILLVNLITNVLNNDDIVIYILIIVLLFN